MKLQVWVIFFFIRWKGDKDLVELTSSFSNEAKHHQGSTERNGKVKTIVPLTQLEAGVAPT